MKMKITVEGCPYEDKAELDMFKNAFDMHSAIFEALEEIRRRLKNLDALSDCEIEFLEKLRDTLMVIDY